MRLTAAVEIDVDDMKTFADAARLMELGVGGKDALALAVQGIIADGAAHVVVLLAKPHEPEARR